MTDFLRIRQERPRLLHREQDSSWLWVTPRESQNKKQTNKAKQTITTKKTSCNEITRGGALDSMEEVTRWREEWRTGGKWQDSKWQQPPAAPQLGREAQAISKSFVFLCVCPCICVCACVHTQISTDTNKCNETDREIKAFQEITNQCDPWTPEQPWRESYRRTPHSVGRECLHRSAGKDNSEEEQMNEGN